MIAVLAAAVLGTTEAPPPDDGPPIPSPPASCRNGAQPFSPPDWVALPTPADIWWSYPPQAVDLHLDGHVVLVCKVSPAGSAEFCPVDSESPPDKGFGAAAITLSAKFHFRPRMICGQAVEGDVRVPVRYQPPVGLPPAEGPAPSQSALAAAKRLMAAMQVDDVFASNVDDQIDNLMRTTFPAEIVQARQVLFDAYVQVLREHRQEVLDRIADVYARNFTTAELGEAAVFFESELGRKIGRRTFRLNELVGAATYDENEALAKEIATRACKEISDCNERLLKGLSLAAPGEGTGER